jgi:transcription initiation factor TFIID subunit TAF12
VAREIGAPAGTKPLLWRLLTTLPVETAEDARQIIRLYRLRWRIEEVFRVLKRNGLALEETQVESARACSTSPPSPSSRLRASSNSPTPATPAPARPPTSSTKA